MDKVKEALLLKNDYPEAFSNEGNTLKNLGTLQEAEEAFKEKALSMGVELHIAGEFELASQMYDAVIKFDPNHADANHNMGLLKLDTGHDLEALPYLQTALQSDTSVAQFWLSYIKTLIKLEKLEDACRILALAKENDIESEEFVELTQLINPPTESAPVSEPEAEIPSRAKPNILDSLKLNQALSLAEKKAKEGNAEEALGIYKDILAKFPKNKKAQQKLAAFNEPPQEIINHLINLYNLGQIHTAAEKAEEILKYYPTAFMAWNILGKASLGLGKLSEASEAFKRVTESNPSYGDGYRNLGVALEAEQKLDEAIEAYKSAIELKDNYTEAHNNLGIALKDQGNLDDAIEAYDKALLIKPVYAEAYNNIGVAFKDLGKLEKAIEAFKKALSLKPDYAEAHQNLSSLIKI
jgi:tetratricopeptide (TPR) repeat protein